MNIKRLPIIGITQGDINGIGYEVIIKVLSDSRIFESFTPVIYGQSKVFSYYKKRFGLEEMSYALIHDISGVQAGRINIINHTNEELKVEVGISTQIADNASAAALKLAMDDLLKGDIDAMVTAPINKKSIKSDSFKYSGNNEFVSSFFKEHKALMLMVWEKLRVGTVTNHMPVKDIPTAISKELILSKIRILDKTLREDFGIDAPKIAVLALNPHSGEEGALGQEERDIIIPAVKEAARSGITAFGPYAADGFFGAASWTKFDGVLSMYHDQGLIPFKTLAIDGGVNFTAGLPVITTSPAHGTAYDIAGKGTADPDSFRHAIYLALDIIKERRQSQTSDRC